MNGSELDQLIDWKCDNPKFNLSQEKRHMQRQFTIEVRVDYTDKDKNEAMRTALAAAARHVFATAVLLADGVKPTIAIFSDDFFQGHEEIALMQDVIRDGVDSISGGEEAQDNGVSSELAAAATS